MGILYIIVCHVHTIAYRDLLITPADNPLDKMTARSGSSPISGRIPNVIFRWLDAKVESGEYPNLNQALSAQLMRAKTLEEERETQKELLQMRSEIVSDVLDEISKKKAER